MIEALHVGDLVRWHSDSWVFSSPGKEYQSPGVVLEEKRKMLFGKPKISFRVLWADGRITAEHECYLRSIEPQRQ